MKKSDWILVSQTGVHLPHEKTHVNNVDSPLFDFKWVKGRNDREGGIRKKLDGT